MTCTTPYGGGSAVCPPPATTTTTVAVPTGNLPHTGSGSFVTAGDAVGLVVLGALLVLAARRVGRGIAIDLTRR